MVGVYEVPQNVLVHNWIGYYHRRRLSAYIIYRGFIDNVGKWYMPDVDETRREYGDAALIRNQALSALLGDDYSIVSEGAEDLITLVKELEKLLQGAKPTPVVDPITQTIIPGEFNTPELSADDKARAAAAKSAQDFQTWVIAWAKKQRFNMKLVDCERNAVGIGDGVYTLGYNPETKSIRLRVFDPGFYFPVLTDEDDDEFPQTVHFAWEIYDTSDEELPPPERKRKIRRITYERVKLDKPVQRDYGTLENYTILMSDGTWEIGDAPALEDLTLEGATWATWVDPKTGQDMEFQDVDLNIGFMPVVHIPNTIAGHDHFGQPIIAHVLQLLEDISLNDTDIQAASTTTGKPPVALVGGRLGVLDPTYKAGEVWQLEPGGSLSILDTSKSLDALLKHNESLLARLSVNTRIPAIALGRAKIEKEIAGISLRIALGPLISLVREMRQVRDEKYDLLFYIMWRMAKQYGVEGVPASFVPTHLRLGGFLPTDLDAVVKQVTELMNAKAISVETGCLMLLQAGLPIENVAEEVLRIQSRDFYGANLLLDATGDQAGVYTYLGRTMPPALYPSPNAANRYNPGNPTQPGPAIPANRGLQADGGPPAPGAPPPAPGAPPPGPGRARPAAAAARDAQDQQTAGPSPQGATWVAGYYQTRP